MNSLSRNNKVGAQLHAPMAHVAEGLRLSALLTLKVKNYLTCFVGARISSVHDGMAIYFALENINNK
jgi:hypothetical protein